MDSGYSLSDIAAVNGRNDGFFGGDGGMWIFALLILLGLGNGGLGGFGGRGASPASEADLCSAMSFNDLKRGVADNGTAISGMYTGLQNGISNFGYETLKNFNILEAQLAGCCCETQRSIDSVKFDMANYAAGINANTNAGIQKILDRMCADKEAALSARIQQLELQAALCGVVRYPNATTFTAGANPFFGGGCGCGCGGFAA